MSLDGKSIGKRIRLLRVDRGWTQKQLAERLRMGRALISLWELERVQPSPRSLKKLEDLFGAKAMNSGPSRQERLAAARDRAMEKAMEILAKDKVLPAEQNAATMTIARFSNAETKTASATAADEIQNMMKGAREEFLRRLARLRLDES